MLEALPKATFSMLAGSATLKRLASRYGMRRQASFARRFIAGESLAEALDAARIVETSGLMVTLDFLGESVASREGADQATHAYIDMVGAIVGAGVSRNLSIKLTQLGLDIDRATGLENLRRVLDVAAAADVFVRIDMENSPYVDPTLDTFESLWNIGYRNVGVVLQSYLRRTGRDVARVNRLGGRVRLVKGAYHEATEVAFQQKTEVDAEFVAQMKVLLKDGHYPAIATHDPAMIDATRAFAAGEKIGSERFEFQMLYGIRRDLQASLFAAGHPFRVYVPFGKEWFPYFMRRLGERPANVGFVVRSVLKESL